MKNCLRWLMVLFVASALASCSTPKKLSYLLDMEYAKDYPAAPAPELVVQVDDCLGIHISCENPKLAAPFNLTLETADAAEVHSYWVDKDGNIDFPVLGTLPVAGKTLKEVKDLIAEKIRAMGLIRNPIVLVSLDNFAITLIGNAGNKIVPVTGNSINILEVLAQSGKLDETTKIKDVMVIRTEGGVRRAYPVDLQSKDLFDSPVFYLKQNDVVYYKPQSVRLSPTGNLIMTFTTASLSLVSIIVNALLWSSR